MIKSKRAFIKFCRCIASAQIYRKYYHNMKVYTKKLQCFFYHTSVKIVEFGPAPEAAIDTSSFKFRFWFRKPTILCKIAASLNDLIFPPASAAMDEYDK